MSMSLNTPVPTHYERLGGAPAVRALVDRFYDFMDRLPEVAPVRAIHPADLTLSRDKLHDFLSGWLGGPALYIEKYGHPRLRARHLPVRIGSAERDQWMLCMHHALEETVVDARLRRELEQAIGRVAEHMRNDSPLPG
jgi:hemoglobin